MGRIKKGILGGFSGKVGNVIGASWRGIDYMRGLPRLSKKAATEKQLGQRHKMRLLRGFILGVDQLVNERFQNFSEYSAANATMSYNLLNTISGTYPEQTINFPQFIYSKGELMSTWLPKALSTQANTLDFSWENSNFTPLCAANDIVTIVVYDTVNKEFCMLKKAGLRKSKMTRIILPENFSGHKVHCYISFYSETRKIASTNEYLGAIKVM